MEKRRLPIGSILITKGFITNEQLFESLELHCKLPANSHIHIGELLISLGYLTQEQLQDALAEQPNFQTDPIGRILIEEGVIEEWQLSRALCYQHQPNSPHERIGTILVEMNFTTHEAIESALTQYYFKYHARQTEDNPKLIPE